MKTMMTKTERVKAALCNQETDRIPFSFWFHLPHYDQDPIALAEEQIRLAKLYNLDFIKMMPFGNYVAQDFGLSVDFFCTPMKPAFERKFGINDISDWENLKPLPACYGTYGKQLQLAQYTSKMLKGVDLPFVQTIFSPMTTAKKLAGPRLFTDIKENPKAVHHALEAITETTINFVKANIEAGVSGFFFATQTATSDLLTLEEHKEFGEYYDRKVCDAFCNDTWFNIMHAHGSNVYFENLANYPTNCINYHDRWIGPSLGEARKLTSKCLLGGVNEKWLLNADYTEIAPHLEEAVSEGGRNGLIVTPGCCIELGTPDIDLFAISTAIQTL